MESNSQISARDRRNHARRKPKPLTGIMGAEEVYAFAALPDEAYVARRTVCALLDVSTVTLDSMIEANIVPQPVRFSTQCIRWRVGNLRAALSALHSQGGAQ